VAFREAIILTVIFQRHCHHLSGVNWKGSSNQVHGKLSMLRADLPITIVL
jgi:hypothetical protein